MTKKKKAANMKVKNKKKVAKAPEAPKNTGFMARPFDYPGNPFRLMRSLVEDMDNMFGDFGFTSRIPLMPSFDAAPLGLDEKELAADFTPPVEILRQDGQVLVRTELPGMKKEDIDIEIADGRLTIRGERKNELKEEKEGYFRTERTYGSFYRQLPLPETVETENAKASFKDGVLEVTMQAPKAVPKAQKLKITEGATESKAATGS